MAFIWAYFSLMVLLKKKKKANVLSNLSATIFINFLVFIFWMLPLFNELDAFANTNPDLALKFEEHKSLERAKALKYFPTAMFVNVVYSH